MNTVGLSIKTFAQNLALYDRFYQRFICYSHGVLNSEFRTPWLQYFYRTFASKTCFFCSCDFIFCKIEYIHTLLSSDSVLSALSVYPFTLSGKNKSRLVLMEKTLGGENLVISRNFSHFLQTNFLELATFTQLKFRN